MVKYALISDIHGNYKALEAFLSYIEKHPVNGIICLGDYVTDSPYPEKTMALLYDMVKSYTCHMLRGNREDYLLDNRDNKQGWKPSSANGTLYYTLQHMTERDLEFFASLPTEKELRIGNCPPLYICHGTPGSVRGNMQEDEGLREQVMEHMPLDYLLGGHSHHQEADIRKEKTYINPGSLGFAIDGVGRKAQFAILTGAEAGEELCTAQTAGMSEQTVAEKKIMDTAGRTMPKEKKMGAFGQTVPERKNKGSWTAEFLSIDYDVDGFLRDFQSSGVDEIGMTLNKAVKKSLVTGVNYFYLCILAMQEEAQKAGKASPSDMPEEIWQQLEERFEL